MKRVLAGLDRRTAARELLAGVTLLAMSVPLNIGYAQIAGLPATAGLYALIVPTLAFALLASTRQVVAAPDAAAAALVFSSLTGLGVTPGGFAAMAAAQAIACGLILLLASRLRLGFLADFLSRPILTGFVAGLALEVLLSQIAKMLGLSLDPAAEFLDQLVHVITHLGETDPWAAGMSAPALVTLLLGRRFTPRAPWALLVLVAATVATTLLDLEARGVRVLGSVPAGPPTVAWPGVGLSSWLGVLPSALALALITIAEGLLMSRSYGERRGYPTEPNRDLLAFGVANVAAGLSASFAVGSSTSRTAAMDQAGSRTQLPSVVLAVGTLLLLLFGTGLLHDVPSPAIGAVVAVAVSKLVGLGELRALARQSRTETGIALACMVGVLLLGPLDGLLLAFVLSLINLARRAAAPPIDVLHGPDDPDVSLTDPAAPGVPTAPGTLVVRFAAPIFFANAQVFTDRITTLVDECREPIRAVVLDTEAITDIDVTGSEAVARLRDSLTSQDILLAWTRLRPPLRDRLDHFGLLDGTREYPTNRSAVSALTDDPSSLPPTG